jgi:hypothetical protein
MTDLDEYASAKAPTPETYESTSTFDMPHAKVAHERLL